MNYRHAYHAGNFADCMKHAVLVWLLRALTRKPSGFCVLDTHAGTGRYELDSAPATRTGEWKHGIGRLLANPTPSLQDYVGLVAQLGAYPGSPMLARAILRPQDRLVCCELHPEDAATLRHVFAGDSQVAVHHRDGWEALPALLPPKERRGLVFIDPPYERNDEFCTILSGLAAAWPRFRSGIFVVWYPIKSRASAREFHAALQASGIRDITALELWIREPLDPARLNGCGLAVVNPPFGLIEAMHPLFRDLVDRLGEPTGNPGFDVRRLVDE